MFRKIIAVYCIKKMQSAYFFAKESGTYSIHCALKKLSMLHKIQTSEECKMYTYAQVIMKINLQASVHPEFSGDCEKPVSCCLIVLAVVSLIYFYFLFLGVSEGGKPNKYKAETRLVGL
jgi:hypothetical protein